MTKQQKINYVQEITFLVIASFGTLLKCCQLFSYGNKKDVKKQIVYKSYMNRNNSVTILSKISKPTNTHN